jgi:hypothetical protein
MLHCNPSTPQGEYTSDNSWTVWAEAGSTAHPFQLPPHYQNPSSQPRQTTAGVNFVGNSCPPATGAQGIWLQLFNDDVTMAVYLNGNQTPSHYSRGRVGKFYSREYKYNCTLYSEIFHQSERRMFKNRSHDELSVKAEIKLTVMGGDNSDNYTVYAGM